ncbi:MAG: hypothetical protein R3F61_07760 [Myxococcota bacterium]
MSGETLLETHIHKHSTSGTLGCLISVPLILAVVVVVNLFIGESDLPPEIRGTTPWLVLITVVTGGLAGWFWVRSRIRLAVVRRDGQTFVEVYDPGAPLVLAGPFDVRYGWTSFHMPKAGTQTLLIVGLYDSDGLALSLTETWGTIYSPPHGWPSDFALEGQARASYTAAGTSFLPDLVNVLLDA